MSFLVQVYAKPGQRGRSAFWGMAGMTRRQDEAKEYPTEDAARAGARDLAGWYLLVKSWKVVQA